MSLYSGQVVEIVQREIKALSSEFVTTDYYDAVNDAYRDTGWSDPLATEFKILWTKKRMKRHLFYMLASQSAADFKVKTYNLQQPFDHFLKLVELNDKEFAEAQIEYPGEFSSESSYTMFGTYAHAGFVEDDLGHDLTYDDDYVLKFEP